LLDVTPQVGTAVLEVENLGRSVWLGVLLQRDDLKFGPDDLARVVKYFSLQLDGLFPEQRLGDVRVGLLLALEKGEEEVRVPLLPVIDRVDGHLEEQREVLVGGAVATELLDLLCVLRLEQSHLASALLFVDFLALTDAQFARTKEALAKPKSKLSLALQEVGVVYKVEGEGRYAKSRLMKAA
jgi:hypothetical protein